MVSYTCLEKATEKTLSFSRTKAESYPIRVSLRKPLTRPFFFFLSERRKNMSPGAHFLSYLSLTFLSLSLSFYFLSLSLSFDSGLQHYHSPHRKCFAASGQQVVPPDRHFLCGECKRGTRDTYSPPSLYGSPPGLTSHQYIEKVEEGLQKTLPSLSERKRRKDSPEAS